MKAAKIATLTAAAGDKTREAHAREIAVSQTRPKIIDEEFPEYQQLLDKAEIDIPPCLSSLFPSQLPPSRGKEEGGTALTRSRKGHRDLKRQSTRARAGRRPGVDLYRPPRTS